ncbi:MAG: cell division protein FtsZ [Prevotellaceae bacterium]|nr:cell division protein FtsZ [Prevotellaceae bacterium]
MPDLIDFGSIDDLSQNIIKVIGVGGGGQNAVRNMYNEGVQGVTFAVCNTDSQSLSRSPIPVKIQLGEGLGAGAKPEVGRKEAESNIEDIRHLLDDGTKMVFITAGMGGGTGTGAAPVVAKVAQEAGILTVGVVTIPFYFERKRKIIKALRGVEELRKHVDALLIVNNERLCDVYSDSRISLKEAFERADNILKDAVKGISELITVHSDGNINLDFRDVETTLRNGGGAIMAMGRASGDHRVERAIIDALDSPLLYGNDIGRAKRILFNIYGSESCPIIINEMQDIDDFFDQLDPNIEVIWGTSTDESLGEDAKVTILATGMDSDDADILGSNGRKKAMEEKDDEYFESLIPLLYKSRKKDKKTTTEPAETEQQPVPSAEMPSQQSEQPTPDDEHPSSSQTPPPLPIEKEEEPRPIEKEPEKTEPGQPKATPQPSIIDKWKSWLIEKTGPFLQEDE